MRIAQEEVFGPVLSIIPFDSDDEAIEIANGSIYGLAAGVWTASINRALKMAHALEAGTVWINTYRAVEPAVAVRRLQAVGIRPRERLARDSRVRAGEKRLDRDDRGRHAEPVHRPLIAQKLFNGGPLSSMIPVLRS